MTSLIVQADDIAITHGTTLGILDAISGGIVRATGLFTNCPDAAFAASRLREMPGVDVGIDLNFVTGSPVLPASDVPGLVVRSRRPGDRLAGRARKVQDVLVDAKVPREERDAWPLVATEDGAVVAVPGLAEAPGWEGAVRATRDEQ